ncbi:hypothetical protein T01_14617 [Trichinella spiralis]|uniref:Uncharacterized protein n=1 Tax=Trichinella spiralis TaxID=6334 RepID=A0A0V1AN08_TRISP|nr:hypothetical protein T01_14617 [Trichinella spiralis]
MIFYGMKILRKTGINRGRIGNADQLSPLTPTTALRGRQLINLLCQPLKGVACWLKFR